MTLKTRSHSRSQINQPIRDESTKTRGIELYNG